jgi:hypothetical protein
MPDLNATARRLASLIEPIVGQVYFSPECHAEYEKLGFDPSPGKAGEVALPDGPAYFTSRGSLMGQVPGEVVAAAFSVFNPAVVVPHVQLGWSRTDAATICAARTRGAVAQLARILGEHPDGIDRASALLRRAASPLKPARSSRGLSPPAIPARRSATRGTPVISCASTAATAIRRLGSRQE